MKIVAIGGGEIGRPGTEIETREIDKEVIKLSGKKHPRVLLLPTASGDSELYYPTFERYYGKILGCETDVLYLVKQKPTLAEIKKKILAADIIYVGGGNTMKMLKVWRKLGVDKILEKAAEQGKILSGLSAGAICWFKYGNSDSIPGKLIKLRGLNFVDLMLCPHYDAEEGRRPSLKKVIMKSGGFALALDNCFALEIVGDEYRIITSSSKAKAYRVYKRNGKVIEEQLKITPEFRPLGELK